MKNLHLVPVNILDLVEKINDNSIRENERNNYILRLETTAAFISEAVTKRKTQKPVFIRKNSTLR
jgi:hypothetical protein